MRLRRTSWAAGLVGVSLSASALAQAPAGGTPVEVAAPNPTAMAAPDVSFDDGWNRDWQWRLGAEAVYMRRDNRSHSLPVIDGPEAFRAKDFDFNSEYGTRLSLGIMEDDRELEVTFLSLKNWNKNQSGTLTHGLDFDGSSAFGGAAGAAQSAVDSGLDPNFLNSGTYFPRLNSAANTTAEADALDYLQSGAAFQQRYLADFQDIEANYKQRNQPGRSLRLGLGFRNVKVRETDFAGLSGSFGSVDADAVGAPSTAGLPSAALTGAGLTFGTGTNDGFIAGDTLVATSRAFTENRLNGMQALAEMRWLESDYFDLDSFGKVGVFYNNASGSIVEQYSATGSNSSTYSRTLSDDKNAVSFLGHVGVTGRLFLRHNVRLVAGYEAMYLAGLAMAPDQVERAATPLAGTATLNLRTDGTMFIHGGRVGLEVLLP